MPAASGLRTSSGADEVGTGTGSDFLRDLLGFFGSSVWDDHGSHLQRVDAGGETTRRREPRGFSGTLEVSPTGSIPRQKDPVWQVTNDKVEASRAMLTLGQ